MNLSITAHDPSEVITISIQRNKVEELNPSSSDSLAVPKTKLKFTPFEVSCILEIAIQRTSSSLAKASADLRNETLDKFKAMDMLEYHPMGGLRLTKRGLQIKELICTVEL